MIGRILGAHGIKGEVKLKSFTEDPKAIATYGPLQTADGAKIEIIRIKPAKEEFICTLKTVTDRNAAEALKGIDLFVDRARLPPEPLLADLIGKPVMHNGQHLGVIAGFQNFGAGELMELENGQLIPVRFVTSHDVTVDLPDGFLDKD
jgi:16S rRNA processing protein RimM